jgi:hypothetical protein
MIVGMEPAGPALDSLELSSLVQSFEDGSVALDRFHHHQHLMVAACLTATAPEAALDRIRRGLQALLARHGKDGYHETVTAFWVQAIRYRLAAQPAGWPLGQRVGDVVAWAETARPLEIHYSRERLADPAARHTFLEPDLEPLPEMK